MARGCHIGQCGSRRKGDCEKKKDGTAPGASEGLVCEAFLLLASGLWERMCGSPPRVERTLIGVFSPAGLFWSSTTRSPGSRAIRPPRTAPPAFPSTLWCSLSCTMPSWIYFNWKSTCSLWLSSSPCNLSPRSPLQSADSPHPLLETTPHSPALWFLGSRHVSFLQCSLAEWRTDSAPGPGNCRKQGLAASVTACAAPNHWFTGSFWWWWLLRGQQKRQYPFAQESVFSVSV